MIIFLLICLENDEDLWQHMLYPEYDQSNKYTQDQTYDFPFC